MNQNHNTATSSTPLESVVQQFEHWRATRGKRGRIPDALWRLVTPLMEQYSQNEIVSALRLNHTQLKDRVLFFSSQAPQKPSTFIEYSLPPVSLIEGCLVEFTCKNGTAVKIRGLTPAQLQPLFSVLLGS